jgi:taurine dioxygenase
VEALVTKAAVVDSVPHSKTLVIWDNWASQHHAVWDYYPEERWGDRVSVVTGDAPRAQLDLSAVAE